MKALEKGETIEASCKTSIEEEIDDDSERASTASEAANKNCSQITKEFNQCTKRLVLSMIPKYLVLLYF